MIPKTKAKELVCSLEKIIAGNCKLSSPVAHLFAAKESAIWAIDEMLREYQVFKKDIAKRADKVAFWQQVKEEIKML